MLVGCWAPVQHAAEALRYTHHTKKLYIQSKRRRARFKETLAYAKLLSNQLGLVSRVEKVSKLLNTLLNSTEEDTDIKVYIYIYRYNGEDT